MCVCEILHKPHFKGQNVLMSKGYELVNPYLLVFKSHFAFLLHVYVNIKYNTFAMTTAELTHQKGKYRKEEI